MSKAVASVLSSTLSRFVPEKRPISTKNLIHNNHSNQQSSSNKDDCSSVTSEGGHSSSVARGGVVTPFPWKVHDMLEKGHIDGTEHLVCWLPHGRAFMVHQPEEFVVEVMPMWFSQTKFASFQRQLNLYGFRRLTTGKDKGAYFHEHFLRGDRNRIQQMSRQKIKGTKVRRAVLHGLEPNFWSLPSMPAAKSIHIIKLPSNFEATTPCHALNSGPPTPTLSAEESPQEEGVDILFFEGKPFHYLDRALVFDNFLPLECV